MQNKCGKGMLLDQDSGFIPTLETRRNGSADPKTTCNTSKIPEVAYVLDQQELEPEVPVEATMGHHCHDSSPNADESRRIHKVDTTTKKEKPKTLYDSTRQCRGDEIEENEETTMAGVSRLARGPECKFSLHLKTSR